ncbi:reverse transcriptase domain-containing protein [Tanacetum coccineum]
MGGQTSPKNYQYLESPQEGLYLKAWQRYNDLLCKCPTYDINNHQKVNIFYEGLSTMNRQLLDSQGPIPGMRPAKALIIIQTMADHSQKWHDGSTSRNIKSNSSNDGLADLVNKLDAKFVKDLTSTRIVPSMRLLNKWKRSDMENLDEQHPLTEVMEENFVSTEMEVWIKKLKENAKINMRNQDASLKNLETQIEQLTKEIHSDKTLDSSSEQIKTITADQETSGLNKLHGVSFISDPESDATEVLQHQLPRKELNPGNFTLPCTIGKFIFYGLGLPRGLVLMVMTWCLLFEHLHLTNLRKTNMLCEMADMSKKAPLGIVENVLVKIGKFLFLSDFVIIDNTPSETTILGRPFLATIRAEIDVFAGKISLGINEDRISFDSYTYVYES